jgi:deazaflavin-dependent oxidoreductase (nitroreductase family)
MFDAHRNPRRLPRLALRLPLFLYSIRLGYLLGKRFVVLKHRGRISGQQRRTVLEVMHHDNEKHRYLICSGWGEASEWYSNLRQNPETEIEIGGRRMKAIAMRLPQQEAENEIGYYARRYPTVYRWLATRLLGRRATGQAQEFAELTRVVPMIGLLQLNYRQPEHENPRISGAKT